MNLDSVPIKVIEEVELVTGYLIEELFEADNKSPYRKRAMAYLSAISQGKSITWDELGNKSVNELWEIMNDGVDDSKKE
jgi:hypothetical protein